MHSNSIVLTGVPRAGTSLACRLLDAEANTVALSEPFKLAEFESLSSPTAAVSYLDKRIDAVRIELLATGVAPSTHLQGALSDARVAAAAAEGGLRRPQGEQSSRQVEKPLPENFRLVIKHNALFAALLPDLSPRYRCVALVRNPLAVLASWQTVDLPVNRGRVPAAELFDEGLRKKLDAQQDTLLRQLDILDWFFSSYQQHLPMAQVVRYETMIESDGIALFDAVDIENVEIVEEHSLQSHNNNSLYRALDISTLAAATLAYKGSWGTLYSQADIEEAASQLEDQS